MPKNIEERIIEIIAEQMGVDVAEINWETRFAEDLNVDSLDQVELLIKIEDEFEVSTPDEEVEQLKTVGQVIEYIKRRLGEDGNAGVASPLSPKPKPPQISARKPPPPPESD